VFGGKGLGDFVLPTYIAVFWYKKRQFLLELFFFLKNHNVGPNKFSSIVTLTQSSGFSFLV
jgi:hypothetical protein